MDALDWGSVSFGRGVIRLTDLYSVLLLPASNFIQNWASASLISCPHQDHWARFGPDHFSVSLHFWFAGWQVHTCSTLEVFCSWGRRWSQLSCHSLVTHLFFLFAFKAFCLVLDVKRLHEGCLQACLFIKFKIWHGSSTKFSSDLHKFLNHYF